MDAARLGKEAASGGKLMSASSKVGPSGRKRKRNKLAAARQAAKPAPKGLPWSLVLVWALSSHPGQPAIAAGMHTVGASTAGASTPIERTTLAVPALDVLDVRVDATGQRHQLIGETNRRQERWQKSGSGTSEPLA